jgi:hypothetical protein
VSPYEWKISNKICIQLDWFEYIGNLYLSSLLFNQTSSVFSTAAEPKT